MVKQASQLKPNYAPVYAALYPSFADLFQTHGYALAVHGSLARDFDVIAVPWAETLSRPEDVIDGLTHRFDIDQIGDPTEKRHGRVAYAFSMGFGNCVVDLSFVSTISKTEALVPLAEVRDIVTNYQGVCGFAGFTEQQSACDDILLELERRFGKED